MGRQVSIASVVTRRTASLQSRDLLNFAQTGAAGNRDRLCLVIVRQVLIIRVSNKLKALTRCVTESLVGLVRPLSHFTWRTNKDPLGSKSRCHRRSGGVDLWGRPASLSSSSLICCLLLRRGCIELPILQTRNCLDHRWQANCKRELASRSIMVWQRPGELDIWSAPMHKIVPTNLLATKSAIVRGLLYMHLWTPIPCACR